jgi:hypothetical protein
MKRITEFPPRDRPLYAPNLLIHAVSDGAPCFYLNEECDYGYMLAGESAFYIDQNQVYATDGQWLYYIFDGYLCDRSGVTHYFITLAHRFRLRRAPVRHRITPPASGCDRGRPLSDRCRQWLAAAALRDFNPAGVSSGSWPEKPRVASVHLRRRRVALPHLR